MISRDYIKDLTAAAIQWRKSDHSQSAYIYNHLLQNPENKVGIFKFFVHRQFLIFLVWYIIQTYEINNLQFNDTVRYKAVILNTT